MQKCYFCVCGPVYFVACILLFIASCSSLLSLFLVSLCLWSPWLINSAVPSYFAGGDRLSHCCRFPHYRTPLVTNTDSSPGAGPKSQLEKSEIRSLKLPSEDYPKLLQLSPSPLPVSSTHRRYRNHRSAVTESQPLGCSEHGGCTLRHHVKPEQHSQVPRACRTPCDRAAINGR